MSEKLDLDGAQRILIPKGDDNKACIKAFAQATDIEIPGFEDELLSRESEGRKFWLVKGSDVPDLVDRGYADIGLTGYDSYLEYGLDKPVKARQIGEEMCRFELLAPRVRAELTRQRAFADARRATAISVATSFPKMLSLISSYRDLPLVPAIEVGGSVEIMSDLTGCEAVADLVGTGDTAAANGMAEIGTLISIRPAIITAVKLL